MTADDFLDVDTGGMVGKDKGNPIAVEGRNRGGQGGCAGDGSDPVECCVDNAVGESSVEEDGGHFGRSLVELTSSEHMRQRWYKARGRVPGGERVLELGAGVCWMGRGLLSKEMGTEAKTAEEEFNVMSCPKFVKMGMQRNKAEAFAECRTFSLSEWKIRRDGEYLTGGGVGGGDGVR
eukprot:g48490.t1